MYTGDAFKFFRTHTNVYMYISMFVRVCEFTNLL